MKKNSDKKPITVFIVDDSKVCRDLLSHIIEEDPDLTVVGTAKDGEEALTWLKFQTPDVITMDIFMPKGNGFAITREIMETKPVPIIIISSAYSPEDAERSFQAIEAGALGILQKAIGIKDDTYSEKAKAIVDTIKTVAGVKLTKLHKIPKTGVFGRPTDSTIPSMTATEAMTSLGIKEGVKSEKIAAIGIGASLGGPVVISSILNVLPANFSIPILIVQHIAEGFSLGFVNWLQKNTALKVQLAKEGEVPMGGHVYVAPDNCHMEVTRMGQIKLDFQTKDFLKPSVSKLFHSLAEAYGPDAIGVLLTGMGKDGAQELLEMKQKGAFTMVQDEPSSSVFGMPGEAVRIGAAHKVLPVHDIAKTLSQFSKVK